MPLQDLVRPLFASRHAAWLRAPRLARRDPGEALDRLSNARLPAANSLASSISSMARCSRNSAAMAAKFSRCGPVTMGARGRGRLQQIVPAAPRQRSAHENDVAPRETGWPARPSNRAARRRGAPAAASIRILRPPDMKRTPAAAQQLLGRIKPLGLARNQDQQQCGMRWASS